MKPIKILLDEVKDSIIVYIDEHDLRIVLTPEEAEDLLEDLEDAIFDEDEHHHALEKKYQRAKQLNDEYEETIHTLREALKCK